MPALSFSHAVDFEAMSIADLGVVADALLGARQSFNLLGCLANHMRRSGLEDFGDNIVGMIELELQAIVAELEGRNLADPLAIEDRDNIIRRCWRLLGAGSDAFDIPVQRLSSRGIDHAA